MDAERPELDRTSEMRAQKECCREKKRDSRGNAIGRLSSRSECQQGGEDACHRGGSSTPVRERPKELFGSMLGRRRIRETGEPGERDPHLTVLTLLGSQSRLILMVR
jgi:hypothetical protein